MSDPVEGHLERAARQSRERSAAGMSDPEPSLARRLAQIGVLGWVIVGPTLLGVVSGNWLDRLLGTGVLFAAALTVLGAALGLWFAFRWMRAQ